MSKYCVNIFALIKANDEGELKGILWKLINASLPEEVDKRLIQIYLYL